MMIKNHSVLFVVIAIISCNSNAEPSDKLENKKEVVSSAYPKAIDSLNLQSLYDSARWWFYCRHCDDTCFIGSESKNNTQYFTFGQADLKLENLELHSDTADLSFNFYYNSTICNIKSDRNFLNLGVASKLSTKKVIAFISSGSLKYNWSLYTRNRLSNPLQPEVKNYIIKNKSKLNPWFYSEAKKRGII